jgi:hypothetical protein
MNTKIRLFAVSAGIIAVVLSVLLLSGSPESRLDSLAKDYVELALSLEGLGEGEVDAYFGPGNLQASSKADAEVIAGQAAQLHSAVAAIEFPTSNPRQQKLLARLTQVEKIARFLADPTALSFAQETRELYKLPLEEIPETTRLDESGRVVIDELPPTAVDIRRDAIMDELRDLLPGTGNLPFKVARFLSSFMVPVEKREEVFMAALQACKNATLDHWELPANENLQIEWTRDVSSPWHEYQGNGQSLLQINPLTMGFVGSMVDVACHEGYPGHHAQYLLRDQSLIGNTGALPVEDSLVLLRSPEAVLLEGSADYAIRLAMPTEQRLNFETEVLFPLAGLDTESIDSYLHIHNLVSELDAATIKTLQAYSDGELPETAAAVALESEAMVASPRALLSFVNDYGAYSAGYTLAEDQVEKYIENRSNASGEDPWSILKLILTDSSLLEAVFSE